MKLPHAIAETLTMIRRDTTHARRNPMLTVSAILSPTIFLLLFVGVFGGSMSRALGVGASAVPYIVYITPGIILMAVGSSVAGTAISATIDKSEGIISRFRTMPIARASVPVGAAVGSVVRTMAGILFMLALATLLGFRTSAGAAQWVEALGFVLLFLVAMTWLGIAIGLTTNSPAGANTIALVPGFLPLVSSAFAPTASMPAGVRWFAENQPYTPLIETLRALLMGAQPGATGPIAVAWCIAIGLVGFTAARALYMRDPSRGAPRR